MNNEIALLGLLEIRNFEIDIHVHVVFTSKKKLNVSFFLFFPTKYNLPKIIFPMMC